MNRYFSTIAAGILAITMAGCDMNSTTSTNTDNAAQEAAGTAEVTTVQAPPIIERSVLFGNPTRFQGRLSPDGLAMSFRAPLDGVMNLWVGDRGDFASVKAITHDTGRGHSVPFLGPGQPACVVYTRPGR